MNLRNTKAYLHYTRHMGIKNEEQEEEQEEEKINLNRLQE
jgi:hypothetical protein